ncbi:hypothetical protein PTKIN_Ptkin11bG0099900 [Pterospermum kingtungense]
MLSKPNEGKFLAKFKYERLPDYCYICGCFDHQEIDCPMTIQFMKKGLQPSRKYGPWLE